MGKDNRSQRIRQSKDRTLAWPERNKRAPLAEEAGGVLIFASGLLLNHSELREAGCQTKDIAAVYFQI